MNDLDLRLEVVSRGRQPLHDTEGDATKEKENNNDHVRIWLVHFFEAHSHQTKYQDEVSVMKTISASIIQGSTIGPASYVVNSSDLNAISEGNALCKYADDT